jgi:hypothetical protein
MIWVITALRLLGTMGGYEDVIILHAAYETQADCQADLDWMVAQHQAEPNYHCESLVAVHGMRPGVDLPTPRRMPRLPDSIQRP